jgi:hypothetical protein
MYSVSGDAVCRIRNQCCGSGSAWIALFLMGWIRNQVGDPLKSEEEMFYFELQDFFSFEAFRVLKH